MDLIVINTYVHTPFISFLGCIGLGANIFYLMSLKADKRAMNNNDRVQCLKTALVILAIVCYIPMEVVLMQNMAVTYDTCMLRGKFIHELLYNLGTGKKKGGGHVYVILDRI